MNPPTILSILLALPLLAAPALASYTSGGTFVAKSQGITVVDNGDVICEGLSGSGIGGGCLPFPAETADLDGDGRGDGAFITVQDAGAGSAVAFQVCIDNDGVAC